MEPGDLYNLFFYFKVTLLVFFQVYKLEVLEGFRLELEEDREEITECCENLQSENIIKRVDQ